MIIRQQLELERDEAILREREICRQRYQKQAEQEERQFQEEV